MVEGAFARAFRSELQPVEVASAVQREMDDRAAIVAKGRTLVPNDFVVELADTDHERLDVYAESLGVELANLARDYAKEQGYSFVGPVRMRFEGVPDMTTGTFRIRSGVIRGSTIEGGEIRMPASDLPRTPPGRGFPGHPRLLVSGPELRVENGQVVLVDLSSTNGTFVNGQPVRRVALTDGTHVSLGRTTLVFRQDGQDDGQGTAYSRTTY